MRVRPVAWPIAAAGVVVTSYLQPVIRLRPERVEVPATAAAIAGWFRAQITEHADVIAGDGAVVVARFSGRAGRFDYRTTEVVRFVGDAVRFEHLRGPFAECDEQFTLQPGPTGTVVEHSGHFRMRWGLPGWGLGLLAVRPAFERHVADRMIALQASLSDA